MAIERQAAVEKPLLRVGQLLVGAGLLAAALAACGGGSTQAESSAVHRACQAVGAVLSDGPDASADPVGYAEAQILPLRQITTSDRVLGSAIAALADAYQDFFDTNGSSAAQRAVGQASRRLDATCPGVTS